MLSIDDFGTGYSSLSYLKRLPIGEIKIDRSFVMNMHENANDAMIVRATTELGRNLGLRVVAEGVETRTAWDQLAAMRCDIAQGYYLSRPIPAQEITRWMALRELDRAGRSGCGPRGGGSPGGQVPRAPRRMRAGTCARSSPRLALQDLLDLARSISSSTMSPAPALARTCSGLRLPAMAPVTPGCAMFHASASWDRVMPRRSATGRIRSTVASDRSRSAR
jgi:hypothetical protein